MIRTAFFAAALGVIALCFAEPADARRIALVIGNSDYTHASVLPNPKNDARDLAEAFGNLGYEVELHEDTSRAALLDALRAFRARSLGADHAIIYYAGHGVEIGRQNFVVPVDAELKADFDVEYEAVPLDLLVAATSGADGLQLVVLDACRDNPFLSQMTRTMTTRSVGRGLAIYEPDGNSLVAYAAREGTVALDGTGQNSPYALAFLSALKRPGLEIGQFFRQVRDAVVKETGGQQEPFLYGSLSAEPVFFRPVNPATPAAPQVSSVPVATENATANTLLNIDLAFWQSIQQSDQASDFEDYLQQFPQGRFRPLAKRRLAALNVPTEAARSASVPAPAPVIPPANAATPAAAPVPVVPSIPLQLTRSQTRDLQARLNILGFSAGVEDGIAGRRTLRAVASYRAARNMEGDVPIDQFLMQRIGEDVSDLRLAAYRNTKQQAAPKATAKQTAPKPKATAPRPNSQTTTAAAPKPKPAAPKPAAISSQLAAYVGRSYCKSNNGQVLNGRNLSDRPIWCLTILSLNSSQLRYRISYRQSAGKPIDKTTFTRSLSGGKTYGPVRLGASASSAISANGASWVPSRIHR
ncbi:MAG: caspase family protein [Pseudomonadota bacterium]